MIWSLKFFELFKSSQDRGHQKEKSQNTTVTSNPILSSGSNVSSPKVQSTEPSSSGNKSATIATSVAAAEKQKQEKPKKKSKLSFLSRKKNKE